MTASLTGKRVAALRREAEASRHIPYLAHLTPTVIQTEDRAYLTVLRVTGAAFESADDEDLNTWHKRLNSVLRSIASQNIVLWQHIVRRPEGRYPDGHFPPGFAHDLNARYAERMSRERLMITELYLTVMYRPQPSRIGKALLRLVSAGDKDALAREREESIEALEKIVGEIESSLVRYDTERLGTYRHHGLLCSAPAEFFGFLVNGEWNRIALAQAPLNVIIPASRPFFGSEAIEIRHATDTTYAAILGIGAYPSETKSTMLDHLLALPIPFVLSQSFAFLQQDSARGLMKRARNRMINSGDDATSQIVEIDDALDDLVSRRFVMGEHHLSLLVKAKDMRLLSDAVALARTALSEAGIVAAREDLAVEAAYWAQLPGNLKLRPRVAAINSRNLSGLMPLHNFPSGRRTGNHWGDALTLLRSSAGTPYYFSLHAADPTDPDGGSKRDVGHTLLLGPTGSGKTVFVSFMLSMMQKQGVTSFVFSKDRDTEIVIKAIGGVYYPIESGTATGWNPFWLDEGNPGTVPFLNRLVRRLVSRPRTVEGGMEIDTAPLSAAEERDIANAVNFVMRMDRQHRSLGRMLDHLTKGAGSIYDRLAPWCHSREAGKGDGQYAWVFDNRTDTLMDSIGAVHTIGFDMTAYLDVPELRTPINMWLFHLVGTQMDGRRLAIVIAEFWKALGDREFSAFARDQLKTLRKQNGLVILDSQSASDALRHEIGRTLIEQTPTKILFPAPDADYQEYTEGLSLSEREYRLIKEEIPEGSRSFLIRQGHHSIVAQLDLKGMDEELAVLSSRRSNIDYVNQLIEAHGPDPEAWLPIFKQGRRTA